MTVSMPSFLAASYSASRSAAVAANEVATRTAADTVAVKVILKFMMSLPVRLFCHLEECGKAAAHLCRGGDWDVTALPTRIEPCANSALGRPTSRSADVAP